MSSSRTCDKPRVASFLGPLLRSALLVALLASPVLGGGNPKLLKETAATQPISPTGRRLQASDSLTYLPSVFRYYGPRSYRLGYGATSAPITQYSDVRQLKAGWYLDWGARSSPARPWNMDYVQVVRLHQLTECLRDDGLYLRDRSECPYVEPYTYTLHCGQTRGGIVAAAQANPGSLWLIGNEPDRHDWGGDNPYTPDVEENPSGGQDEMLPEVYAQAYHEFYRLIKEADPDAQVAIGGIIQATPVRLEYLTKVWDAYPSVSGGDTMPVDVWNVHNFIFKEKCDDFGADIPPGCELCRKHDPTGDPCYGVEYGSDQTHASMDIFEQQIVRFREWMRDLVPSQRDKPLIVSEYGIVYYHEGLEDEELVKDFMLDTFDYFMNTKDCDLGYRADDCRLVQRWAWYSLDDDWKATSFNKYGVLIDRYEENDPHLPIEGGRITPLGQAFADYAGDHLDTP